MSQLIIDEPLARYATEMTSEEGELLAALNRETHLKVKVPEMLSGRLQGVFLRMVSRMIRPQRILEIGTYTGYSAICLAQGLQPGGELVTIELDEELEDFARGYFLRAGLEQQIRQYIGDAREVIPQLEGSFDLVFIDADKPGYSEYFDLIMEKVPVGGFILADNVLFSGEVVAPPHSRSKNAVGVSAFNEKVRKDPRVSQVLLPIRDGIMLMEKIA